MAFSLLRRFVSGSRTSTYSRLVVAASAVAARPIAAPACIAAFRGFASKGGKGKKGKSDADEDDGAEAAAAPAKGDLLRNSGIGGNAFDEKALQKKTEAPLARLKDELGMQADHCIFLSIRSSVPSRCLRYSRRSVMH
jgi:hypothetical protein